MSANLSQAVARMKRITSPHRWLRNGFLISGLVLLGWASQGCTSANVQPEAEHPNVTLVNRYLEAGPAGDLDTLREIIHEDVVMHFFGDNPVSGVHRGREDAWDRMNEEWGSRNLQFEIVEVQDVVANDERAWLLMKVRISGPDASVDLNRVDVYRIVDGRIVELWVYDDDQDAIDELFR